MYKRKLLTLLCGLLFCCNGSKHVENKVMPVVTASAIVSAMPEHSSSIPVIDQPVEFKISSVGDLMKYDVKQFEVKEGAQVHVVFHSNATLDGLPHNWVLVRSGSEAAV